MPLFYFDLDECGSLTCDREGRVFSDLEAAKGAAIADARSIMREDIAEGALCVSCHINISNADGTQIARVPFCEAVEIFGLPVGSYG
ncbi:DUF6894 family protein [Sphingomonas endolithica]|uniref:DUF6894 family protein n=1 Tax=Sphingomonas endolithica TaxID=2972485 RepID=UPI003AAB3072